MFVAFVKMPNEFVLCNLHNCEFDTIIMSENIKPQKKTPQELNDFLSSLESYNPTVPDAVSKFYLERNGVSCKDDKIPKLVSLACDKLLSEILYEAKQINILRTERGKKRKDMGPGEVLELEDLHISLKQIGVNIRRRKILTDENS